MAEAASASGRLDKLWYLAWMAGLAGGVVIYSLAAGGVFTDGALPASEVGILAAGAVNAIGVVAVAPVNAIGIVAIGGVNSIAVVSIGTVNSVGVIAIGGWNTLGLVSLGGVFNSYGVLMSTVSARTGGALVSMGDVKVLRK